MFIFKNDQYNKFEKTVGSLSKVLTIQRERKLKWFLGLYIIRNRSKRALKLLQKVYIIKIHNNLAPNTTISQLTAIAIKSVEFLATPNNKNIIDVLQIIYQQKVELFIFAVIAIWLNIAFAVLLFLQFKFNQQQEKQYHKAIDQMFDYLFQVQDYYICYRKNIQDILSFIFDKFYFW